MRKNDKARKLLFADLSNERIEEEQNIYSSFKKMRPSVVKAFEGNDIIDDKIKDLQFKINIQKRKDQLMYHT